MTARKHDEVVLKVTGNGAELQQDDSIAFIRQSWCS